MQMKVYYLGPTGSYHSIAAQHLFDGDEHDLKPMKTFTEIYKALEQDDDAVGIVALENSSTSNVHENFDNIFKRNLHIISEIYLQINLHLMALPSAKLSDITKVYSHPKAMAQSEQFLQTHGIEMHPVESTSHGKRLILEKGDIHNAALGSKLLAEDGQVHIVAENIGDNKRNVTRFVVLSPQRSDKRAEDVDKLTFHFKTKHRPGALAKVLTALADIGANLTHIESRPIPGTDWEYSFWIDVKVNPQHISDVIEIMKETTLEMRIIGKYKEGETIET